MKVLVAEDDPIWRASIEALLRRWGYQAIGVGSGDDALEVLSSQESPRLAILDWIMPGMDGIEVCRTVRRMSDRPYVYLILVTSKDRKEDIIAGLEAGADDYITKPFDSQELRVRLRAGQRIVELQDALLHAQEELRIQAAHDALTGLLNHGAIIEILHREIHRAERERSFVGVIIGDLDHFKRVNDTYGHLAGDAILRQAATRLHSVARSYDAIGRYGGEEFLIVLSGGDVQGALHLAERILHVMSADPMDTGDGTEITVTISLGVVASDDNLSCDPNAIITAADNALYRAKHAGRNRIAIADEEDLKVECPDPGPRSESAK